ASTCTTLPFEVYVSRASPLLSTPSSRPVTLLVEMICDAPAPGAYTAETTASSTRIRRMPPLVGRAGRGLDHSVGSALVAELLREDREGVEPPGEVEIAREVDHRLADERQVPRLESERVEAACELLAPRVAPEVRCERLDRAVVDAELPVRVAAGG